MFNFCDSNFYICDSTQKNLPDPIKGLRSQKWLSLMSKKPAPTFFSTNFFLTKVIWFLVWLKTREIIVSSLAEEKSTYETFGSEKYSNLGPFVRKMKRSSLSSQALRKITQMPRMVIRLSLTHYN